HQRNADLRPAIEQAAELQSVARQRAAGPVAVLNFQADAGQAQLAADERVGKVVGSQLLILAGDVLGPRLIEADDERRASVVSPDAIDSFDDQPQSLLFGKCEGTVLIHPRSDVPELNFAAI